MGWCDAAGGDKVVLERERRSGRGIGGAEAAARLGVDVDGGGKRGGCAEQREEAVPEAQNGGGGRAADGALVVGRRLRPCLV